MKTSLLPVSFVVLLFFFLICHTLPSAAGQDNGSARLAVIAASNESPAEELDDLLIARGIANLVAQSLYDTGRYRPVEEKPEIRSRIDDLVRRHLESAPEIAGNREEVNRIREELNCQAIAWAVVKDLNKKRRRSSFGPFSSAKTTITVTVEVYLQERGRQTVSAKGEGQGVTRASGVVFQIRDDRIAFDETTAGQAVQQAVKEAVGKLAAR